MWAEQSDWLPTPETKLPSGVFWGIFLWNFPILAILLVGVGYGVDRFTVAGGTPSLLELESPRNLMLFMLSCGGVAAFIDFLAMFSIRTAWNRRAKWLNEPDEMALTPESSTR